MYRILGYDEPTDRNSFIIYDAKVHRYISSGKLTLKEREIDDLTIEVNQKSPLYDKVKPMHTHVEVYDDNDLIFRGRALKPTKIMDSNGQFKREFVFESIESYLMDSVQRFTEVRDTNPKDFLKMLLEVHNGTVPDYKKFILRNCDVMSSSEDSYRYVDYQKTRDVIKDKLLDKVGGYLRFEYKDGKNYLDYMWNVGSDHKNDTPIRIGRNMKSASVEIDPTKVISILIPLGAELEDNSSDSDDGSSGGTVGSGPTEPVNGDWTPVIQYAAKLVGENLSDADIANIKNRIRIESGGSETVTNNWDSNAQAGHPSTGLVQFIQGTFNYYSRPPFTNIHKGLDQLIAMMNIPNWRVQISGNGGWSPHGEPISKAEIKVSNTTSGGSWAWPFPDVGEGNFMQSQKFGNDGGYRPNSFHDGLDFGSVDHPGRDVHAVHGGKVTQKGYIAGLEYYVVISGGGYNVVYQEAFSSMSNIKVNVGDNVKTGDVIGYRDTSHLHIGITKADFNEALKKSFTNDGTWLDPQQIIKNNVSDDTTDNSSSSNKSSSNSGPRPRLTVADVNGGKDFIEIENLESEFTPISGIQTWDDVKDANTLMQRAKQWITNQIPATEKWQVSAVELPQYKSFKVSDRYMFINPNVAKTQLLRVTEKEIDILNPMSSSLTIADKSVKLSDYQLEFQNATKDLEQLKITVADQATALRSIRSNSGNTTGDLSDLINSLGSINLPQLAKDYQGLEKSYKEDKELLTNNQTKLEDLEIRLQKLEEAITNGE